MLASSVWLTRQSRAADADDQHRGGDDAAGRVKNPATAPPMLPAITRIVPFICLSRARSVSRHQVARRFDFGILIHRRDDLAQPATGRRRLPIPLCQFPR